MILQTILNHILQQNPTLHHWHQHTEWDLTTTPTPTTITLTKNPQQKLGPQITLTLTNTTLTITRRIITGPDITTHIDLTNPNSIQQIEKTITNYTQFLQTYQHPQQWPKNPQQTNS